MEMKTAVSLPDDLFHEADATARGLGISRSELYSTALRAYLRELDRSSLQQRIDAALESIGDESPIFARAAARRRLDHVEW